MTQPGQPAVDTTYLDQTATALHDENVTVTSDQLAWAIGIGGQAVSAEELPNWEDRGRLAVLVLAGASPADLLLLAGASLADLLREVAYLVEQTASAGIAAPAAPAQANPLSGLLGGQQPPVPGAAPAAPAQPTAPRPTPPPRTPKATKPAGRQGRRTV